MILLKLAKSSIRIISLKYNQFKSLDKNLKKVKKDILSFNSSPLSGSKPKHYKTNKAQNLKRKFTVGGKISKQRCDQGQCMC